MKNKKLIIIISLISIALISFLVFFSSPRHVIEKPLITNFEECKNAGYPIMESYPAQCRTASGELFVEVIPGPNPEPINPAPAPEPNPIPPHIVADGYVAGHVTIGPFCPVERVDQPCLTPTTAYTSRSVVIYKSDGMTVIIRIPLDTEGNYKTALVPGKYFLQIDPAGIGPGEKKPATVIANQTTIVNFDIDTGIR